MRDRLPPVVEAAIYFAVSESLANVAKHARASRASVTLEERDGRILALVVDDGVAGTDAGQGTGLVGLTDRIGAVGGTLEVISPAGGGTRVMASIPLLAAGLRAARDLRAMRVVIADDSLLFREGLARLLVERGFEVVGQARDVPGLL